MAKKKKTQLKPVARGFATTSVPKKEIPKEDTTVELKGDTGTMAEASGSLDPQSGEPIPSPSATEQHLQVLVDKLQEKTEKEIARIVKAIETDRRISKTLTPLSIDNEVLAEITQSILDTNPSEDAPIDWPKEKTIARLAIAYGVLRRLGFPEGRVIDSLSAIAGVELDDAYDWLCLHPSAEDVTLDEEDMSAPRTPRSPLPQESFEHTSSRANARVPQKFGLDALAPTFVPGNQVHSSTYVDLDTPVVDVDIQRSESSEFPQSEPTPKTLSIEESAVPDIFDEAEEVNLFSLLEELPSEEILNSGTVVVVYDMSLPKHWSGSTPKQLLRDAIARMDKYAIISYRSISSGSRVKRAAATITWVGGKFTEWTMNEIGCHDELSAEHYVSLLALHAVTFPETVGFAGGHASPTFFRALPAVYRDLWEDMESQRRSREDAINRSIWSKLEFIIEQKKNSASLKGISQKTAPPKEALSDSSTGPARHHLADESLRNELKMSLRARQASPEYQQMLLQRSLPIARHRQELLETLVDEQVYVLCGETGCGKSTQLPAYILEDELSQGRPCKILCTEPRRISAISLAERVNQEFGFPRAAIGSTSFVGYSVRLETKTSKHTRLNYVTNGVALRMLEGSGFDDITHVIVDEVHERTIESDFLLIALKSLMQNRPTLKVVLMSATLDAEKFSQYFGKCRIITVPGRTFPVDVRFLEDAVELTHWTVKEDSEYVRRYNDKYNTSKVSDEALPEPEDGDDDSVLDVTQLDRRYSASTTTTINQLDERLIAFDLIIRLLELVCIEDATFISFSAAILIFVPGLQEIRRLNDMITEHPVFCSSDFVVYPLHSTIAAEEQSRVFDIPPPGVRKIVISTNIAETGVTIPDVTCVIDSGKHREMRFDEKRQISRLIETFIAKSNAAQRRGRAGRVQPGLCFHLMTRARHDHLAEHPIPEMLRLSLSDLALRIKIVEIKEFAGSSIEEVLSRALDPPLSLNVQRAISALVEVQALTSQQKITSIGLLLSKLPMDVHLGKFLLAASLFRCLDPALSIVAALNSKSPFITPFGQERESDDAKRAFSFDHSDFSTLHSAFASWRRASMNPGIQRFCRQNYISHQTMQQIEELRQQYCSILIDSGFIESDPEFRHALNKSRYGRHRTRCLAIPTCLDTNSSDTRLLNAALAYGLYPKLITLDLDSGTMKTLTNNQSVQFHPTSVNFKKKLTVFGSQNLIYFTIMHSRKRLYAWQTGIADDIALILLCGDVDFKSLSNMISVDRKLKYRASSQTSVALKHLRKQLMNVLSAQYRGRTLTSKQERWKELGLKVLWKWTTPAHHGKTSIIENFNQSDRL